MRLVDINFGTARMMLGNRVFVSVSVDDVEPIADDTSLREVFELLQCAEVIDQSYVLSARRFVIAR